jgi:hypothetical protein
MLKESMLLTSLLQVFVSLHLCHSETFKPVPVSRYPCHTSSWMTHNCHGLHVGCFPALLERKETKTTVLPHTKVSSCNQSWSFQPITPLAIPNVQQLARAPLLSILVKSPKNNHADGVLSQW